MAVVAERHYLPFFRHLSPRRADALLAASSVRRYAKGHVVFRQGARAEAVWIVLEGWVHVVHAPTERNGLHAVVLCTITPAEVLCGISAIEPGTYTASGMAGTACRVLRVPAALFHDAVTQEPEFAYHTLRLCAERIRHMAAQYGMMAQPVSHRIIRAILRLRQQFGQTLPVTHRELAQMSWTTTESAIRTVRALKRQGYVRGTRGRLTVNRIKALTRLVEPHGRIACRPWGGILSPSTRFARSGSRAKSRDEPTPPGRGGASRRIGARDGASMTSVIAHRSASEVS